jgi:hypothetical protein
VNKKKIGRPNTLPEPWRTLAERAGGVEALGRVFVVTPRAIHRWAHGTYPMAAPHKIVFERLLKEAGLDQAGAKNKNED